MTPDHLDPFAKILINSYRDTQAYSAWFMDRHGSPPTRMSKAHHLRGAAQVAFAKDVRYTLQLPYLEFGRVAVVEVETGQQLVLRSEGAVAAEERSKQGELYGESYIKRVAALELLVIYAFTAAGLRLALAGAARVNGSRRLRPSGPPVHMGVWPYQGGTGPDGSFDQGSPDLFRDLGDLDLGEEDEG